MTPRNEQPPVPIFDNRARFSFSRFAAAAAQTTGSSWVFAAAVMLVIVWGLLGPKFNYSDSWQLVINTGTTIITFLMVFLIQNTQNRDTRAINLKLDEIIRSLTKAHNEMIDIEKLSDEELQHLEKHYERIRKECDLRKARELLRDATKDVA